MHSLFAQSLQAGSTATPEAVQFWILAPLAVLAALGMLLVKKAVHSALLLAWVMITLAILYIAQGALFLGIVQVVVYTGAVMMLFLFILMLVGVDSSDSLIENIKGQRPAAIAAAIGIVGLLLSLISRETLNHPATGIDAINAKNRPVVMFILERIQEPIHPNIYQRAVQLNYDQDILNTILSKLNQ